MPSQGRNSEPSPEEAAADTTAPSVSPTVEARAQTALSNAAQLELVRAAMQQSLTVRLTARGWSMSPFIRDFDVLTIAPLDGAQPCLGDVIAFVSPQDGRLLVHRVVARVAEGWLVRGDSCSEADGTVGARDVLGRVVRVQRDGSDVRAGLGRGRSLIAYSSRGNLLAFTRTLWHRLRGLSGG